MHAGEEGHARTAWMDNIKTWTGLSVEESVRLTEDRDKWRKYVHGVANPRIEDGQRTGTGTEHQIVQIKLWHTKPIVFGQCHQIKGAQSILSAVK